MSFGVTPREIVEAVSRRLIALFDNPPEDTSLLEPKLRTIAEAIKRGIPPDVKAKLIAGIRESAAGLAMLYFTFASGRTLGIFSGRFAFKLHKEDEGNPETLVSYQRVRRYSGSSIARWLDPITGGSQPNWLLRYLQRCISAVETRSQFRARREVPPPKAKHRSCSITVWPAPKGTWFELFLSLETCEEDRERKLRSTVQKALSDKPQDYSAYGPIAAKVFGWLATAILRSHG